MHARTHRYQWLINQFTIPQFLKWAHRNLNLNASIVANRDIGQNNYWTSTSVVPDEMARYGLSHLDLHCDQVSLLGAWLKGLMARVPDLERVNGRRHFKRFLTFTGKIRCELSCKMLTKILNPVFWEL